LFLTFCQIVIYQTIISTFKCNIICKVNSNWMIVKI